MRAYAITLLVLCLCIPVSPAVAGDANFEIFHYTPCEVLWVENGQNVGLIVDGREYTGRISPISFPPVSEEILADMVTWLLEEEYLAAEISAAEAVTALRAFEGHVQVKDDGHTMDAVHAALLEHWSNHRYLDLPPQALIWLSLAGAEAVYLDLPTGTLPDDAGPRGDLALYAYQADWSHPGSAVNDTFTPLGYEAFKLALDIQLPVAESDWPVQYVIPSRPWINFVSRDDTDTKQLKIGEWTVAVAPYAIRLEETKSYAEYAAESQENPLKDIEQYRSFMSDDRGRIAFSLEVISHSDDQVVLTTYLRLLFGQGVAINMDQPDNMVVTLKSYSRKDIEALRNRAGLK